jgi:hypothetical protein
MDASAINSRKIVYNATWNYGGVISGANMVAAIYIYIFFFKYIIIYIFIFKSDFRAVR